MYNFFSGVTYSRVIRWLYTDSQGVKKLSTVSFFLWILLYKSLYINKNIQHLIVNNFFIFEVIHKNLFSVDNSFTNLWISFYFFINSVEKQN